MRKNASSSFKLQVSTSEMVAGTIGAMAARGLFGRNRSDVANHILTQWIWQNADQLARQGIVLSGPEAGGDGT